VNGDLGKIYKAINDVDKRLVIIQTRQEERHVENQRYIKRIDNLPCEKYLGKVDGMATQMKYIWILMISVVLLGIILK